IRVYEVAPDADELLMNDSDNTDEIAAAEAAAALAAVETEAGRTTDPVRMYMREMGTVELLTREGEIAIAKRIEEGLRELMHAIAFWPGAVRAVVDEYDLIEKGERRISDVISGWLDPFEAEVQEADIELPLEEKSPAAVVDDEEAEEASGDTEEDETNTGIDPEVARLRFEELRAQLLKAQVTLE